MGQLYYGKARVVDKPWESIGVISAFSLQGPLLLKQFNL
jgi:hypothetical protein